MPDGDRFQDRPEPGGTPEFRVRMALLEYDETQRECGRRWRLHRRVFWVALAITVLHAAVMVVAARSGYEVRYSSFDLIGRLLWGASVVWWSATFPGFYRGDRGGSASAVRVGGVSVAGGLWKAGILVGLPVLAGWVVSVWGRVSPP